MSFTLPQLLNAEEFDQLDIKNPLFLLAAEEICRKKKIPTHQLRLAGSGSLPVFLIGSTHVLKFFPSLFEDAFKNECSALELLSQKNVTTPQLLDCGPLQSWHFILMTQLPGQSLKELWPQLSSTEKQQACTSLGQHLRQMHEITSDSPAHLSLWSAFAEQQKTNCVAVQRKKKLPEHWLNQIEPYLARVEWPPTELSFLHTEVMSDHVFFSQRRQFTGFIDFEPSMFGPREYDFASVGLFVTAGDPAALRSFFTGYGNLEESRRVDFRRRIMAYTLLHRYSNLNWYLQFMPKAERLEDLADLWWGVG